MIEALREKISLSKEFNEAEKRRLLACLNIVYLFLNEKSEGPFICGHGGSIDDQGLPDRLYVCPKHGLDGFAQYSKTTDYSAPGY